MAASAAFAAEVVEAEVDGTTNQVSVEQGGSATFAISVKATGTIRCAATPETPATVRLNSSYAIGPTGSVSVGELSDPISFYGSGSGTCSVTWPGDPQWQTISATVSADINAPLGDRVVRLRPVMSTPPGTGATLRDDTPTLITLTVVPGSDRVPPEVRCDGPFGAVGEHGWRLEATRYDCTASDAGVGLTDVSDASFSLTTDGEGPRSTTTRVVADKAGNTTQVGPFGPYNVDLHNPSVTVASPGQDASYLLGSDASASYDCGDTPDGSGVERCDAAALDTGSVGTKTLTVLSRDNAGRVTEVSRTYHVVYDVSALGVAGAARTHQAGSTLVVRWSLGGVDDTSTLTGTAVGADCADVAVGGAESAATSNLRSDDGTYALNWKTDKSWAGSCRQLQLFLNDGTTRVLNVQFK